MPAFVAAAALARSLDARTLALRTSAIALLDDVDLAGVAHDVSALWSHTPWRSRVTLLFDYARIYGKRRLSRRGVIEEPTREHILGYSVRLFGYRRLEIMFRELFVDCCYQLALGGGASPLIIDAGANIGLATLFFKHTYPNARVLAFEPEHSAFELLRENVRRNGLSDVQLFNVALYDRDGTVPLYVDRQLPASLTSSTIFSRMPTQACDVPAARLSTYLVEPVALLKMDVEGAETIVLRELADSGKLGLIEQMVIEFHHHVDDRETLATTLQLLERAGFGYQISVPLEEGFYRRGAMQDILLHVYRQDLEAA